jgi:hypothetical protein
MTPKFTLRVTIVVPEAMIAQANALALVLGRGPADVNTFKQANFQDTPGNRYAVASTVAREIFVTAAGSPLVAPDFAPDVDLALAGQAQAMLTIYDPVENPATASPTHILTIIHEDSQLALQLAGVTPIPIEGGA